MAWRLVRIGKSHQWRIEILGDYSKWIHSGRLVEAKNEDDANKYATAWMLTGGHRAEVEKGGVVNERIKAQPGFRKAAEQVKDIFKERAKAAFEPAAGRGQPEAKALNKGSAHSSAMAKKATKSHKSARESKTGVAAYVAGHTCGRGHHRFVPFGTYAVCTACGSRKNLKKTHVSRSKPRKSSKGKHGKQTTRRKVEEA